MSGKIEPIDSRISLAKSQQLTQQNVELARQGEKSKSITQVIPAQSALEFTQSQLDIDLPNFDSDFFENYSLQEAQENIGLAIGNFVRMRGGYNPRVSERSTRGMLQRLAKNLEDADPDSMSELRHRIGGVSKVEEIDDLLNSFQRHRFDTGESILLLANMLNGKEVTSLQHKEMLKQALTKIIADDKEWVLKLFARVEFGATNLPELAGLRLLYQQAVSSQPELLYWLKQFSQYSGDQRHLRTLIRTLAFELSAGYKATDIRLAAVITDLKWVLQFLTIKSHSHRLANYLDTPNLTGEKITHLLLEIVQQSWLYIDWLDNEISAQVLENKYSYAKGLMELIKLLPDTCFMDDEQRNVIIDTFLEYLQKLDESE